MTEILKDINPTIQLLMILAFLALLPFIFACMTSFLRYVIVFAILRTSIGTAQVPPVLVIIGFSLVLTLYTMMPVFSQMHEAAQEPLKKDNAYVEVITESSKPLKEFMLKQIRHEDILFFLEMTKKEAPENVSDLSMTEVIPAFILSEIRTGLTIGFLLFIPFCIIDLLVTNLLLSLGVFMLTPTVISLPFKLLIFIGVDGWTLLVTGIMKSFN